MDDNQNRKINNKDTRLVAGTGKVSCRQDRQAAQAQYQQQTSVLMMVIMATVVVVGLVVLFNWRNAGNTKAVDCTAYPQYCVPLAGGSPDQDEP